MTGVGSAAVRSRAASLGDARAGPKAALAEAVVHTTLRPPNRDVDLIDAPGVLPRPPTTAPALGYNTVFSPGGRWVVFTSEWSRSADL